MLKQDAATSSHDKRMGTKESGPVMIEPSPLDSSVPTNSYLEKKNSVLATTSIDENKCSDISVCAAGAEVEQHEQGYDLKSHPMEDDNDGDSSSISEKVYTGFYKYMHEVNHCRLRCGQFVNQEKVQVFLVVLIAINAIMMGIGTYSFVRNDAHLSFVFQTVDLVFLVIFTIELLLQFIYYGWKLLLDGWLLFDLVVIVTSWSFSSTQVIRAFRIFRALRLVTRIKVLKNLISALFGVVPRMAAIGLMLALIFYIFAVMFTQLFDGLQGTEFDYFGNMGWTLFTLFQMMTLDNWSDICREVMETYAWAWVPFIAFVIISGFIVVNLIIAVICDAIASLHASDKAKIQGKVPDEGDSQESSKLEIREQLDGLEEQVVELTRIQAKTFSTLQYLTRQMQMHKLKKELASKSSMAEAARNLKKVQRELSLRTDDAPGTTSNAS